LVTNLLYNYIIFMINNDLNDDNNNSLNLGGFPSIIYLNKKNKEKREFQEKYIDKLDLTNIKKLNILNIKNILKK